MELEELIDRIQDWREMGKVNKQLNSLEYRAEGKLLPGESAEDIINSIRQAIQSGKELGMDMSKREEKLAELEEKLRERDKAEK